MLNLKYIIQNYVTKQIAGSFDIKDDKVFYLTLHVGKELDVHFYTVLRHLHTKPNTKITLVDDSGYIPKIELKKEVPNWYYDKNTFTFTRKENTDFIGMYFIWDLIDVVRANNETYNLNFNDSHHINTLFTVKDDYRYALCTLLDINIVYLDAKPLNTVIKFNVETDIRIIYYGLDSTCSKNDNSDSHITQMCNILKKKQ